MRMRIAVMFLAVLGVAVSSGAWAANKYQYVIDATNRISELTSQSVSPRPEALAKASSEACFAVTQLLEDREFRADLDKMTVSDTRTLQERRQIKRDIGLFVAAFLRPEEAALRKAGLKEEAIKEILWSAAMFRNSLDDKYDPNRIIMLMDKFHAEVCEEAKALQQSLDEEKRISTVRKWSTRMGGISLIVVDVTVALATAPLVAPLTGPVVMGSIAIGTVVASWPE